jgi:hypothetical protein
MPVRGCKSDWKSKLRGKLWNRLLWYRLNQRGFSTNKRGEIPGDVCILVFSAAPNGDRPYLDV